MNYANLVNLYFERDSALQWYWTLYVIIIGGLLAFSSLRQRPDLITAILVTVLFAFFAYKNLGAIHDVTEQRTAAATLIRNSAPAPVSGDVTNLTQLRQTLEPTLVTPAYEGVRNFHIASDVLTIAAFWAMEYRRRRIAAAAAAAAPSRSA
jgi:hypothetical protein